MHETRKLEPGFPFTCDLNGFNFAPFWGFFSICFSSLPYSFSCNPIPCDGCSALPRLNSNKKASGNASGKHLCRVTNGTKYSRMNQVKFVEDNL